MDGRRSGQTRVRIKAVDSGATSSRTDFVAIEEPMEIRLRHGERTVPVAVTMRTPGADFELAAGFLFAEGVIATRDDLTRIEYCVDCEDEEISQRYNIVTAVVKRAALLDSFARNRNFAMTSACGLCGKERLDQIERQGVEPITSAFTITTSTITALPDRLRQAQGVFATTGGLHAAALFDADGNLLAIREDVGRHNAVDKVIGWALLEGSLPLGKSLLMVSGRTSFEIAQKALSAGIPMLCSVSAPSSLAIDLCQRFGMTLVGFVRNQRFNIYHGAERVQ